MRRGMRLEKGYCEKKYLSKSYRVELELLRVDFGILEESVEGNHEARRGSRKKELGLSVVVIQRVKVRKAEDDECEGIESGKGSPKVARVLSDGAFIASSRDKIQNEYLGGTSPIWLGSNGEDPHKYLRDFSCACDLLRPHGGEVPKVVSCGVCGMLGHHNDQCPKIKEVKVMRGFKRNDSQSNIYNSGWKDHSNLRLSQSRKEFKNDEELLEFFKKVEVNLPLLTATKSIPRSFISPLGVVEDALVKVGHLMFTEFYINEMNKEFARTSPTILLGRPFLKTAKAIINVDKGLLSVEFDGNVMSFNIFDHVDNEFAKEKPTDDDLSIFLNFVTSINDEHALVDNVTTHEQHALGNNFTSSNEHDLGRDIKDDDEQILKSIDIDNDHDINTHIKNFEKENDLKNDSCEENEIELKVLPFHLKYVFLGEKNTYVVVSIHPFEHTISILRKGQNTRFNDKGAFNPTLKEVVKKEVLKLKDIGIIYLVLHNTWLNPIHVVTKKIRMTIVKNSQDQMIE
ncbi:Retrovirus-related Pol polyprotein from transposon 17.6 [Cucumis melo var. makuwa]|uniref:Retrovirus-related Pol polyprotein from transposon 17.6 n=1 Tax=Cucumis melo var. makuwa TaxID=1194695 RepID=A0A5A7VIZ2_CUCMM|nr:Retrovirus-related Pol polyprotein from transposon 17.6 [Cucumis melo var. makuwa]